MINQVKKQIMEELELWAEAGKQAKIWWRDDDATRTTPALERLCELSSRHQIPVLLAIIPKFAEQSLADFANERPLLKAAVHGYAHEDHSLEGQKKTELTSHGNSRSVEQVLDELRIGQNIIQKFFGRSANQILVPPWNRIDPEIVDRLSDNGFALLSGFSFGRFETDIPQLNCQLDLMNWKPERQGKDPVLVFTELLECLQIARCHDFEPIGILSHHLVHDNNAWASATNLMAFINTNRNMAAFCAHDFLARHTGEPRYISS